MKKFIGYTLLVLLVLLIAGGSYGIWKFNNSFFGEKSNLLTYSQENKQILFEWANDSIGNYVETKNAIVIPLKIKGLTHDFYMQFDTGSPYTFIYENDLNSLKEMGLSLDVTTQGDARYVENLEFVLGGNKVKASMVRVLGNYGNTFDESDTLKRIKIGTIGSDFLVNRITAIDFKDETIQFYSDRPDWMNSLPDFEPFDFAGRRCMLPVTIKGKKLELLYDSGCSPFGLITSKNRFDNYTDEGDKIIEYDANSWGNAIPIKHKATGRTMEIGTTELSLKRVSYVDMYAWTQRFVTPFTRVGGFLGNRPFPESTLILDTQKEEFIVIKSSKSN